MSELLVDQIAEAVDDERLRQREPCQHTAPVSRCVYDDAHWLAELRHGRLRPGLARSAPAGRRRRLGATTPGRGMRPARAL